MRVLAVCTGNICRSPFAEVYLRQRAQELSLSLECSSAGTYALEGNRSTLEAVMVAKELGFDLKVHRASMLDRKRLETVDLVLVMSRTHEEEVLDLRGAGREKPAIYLLGQFHPSNPDPPDVDDPIGGSLDDYRACYKRIAESCDALLDLIRQGKVT